MATPSYTHDPDAFLDYTWDWAQWLPDGDTIVGAEILTPDGITSSIEGFNATTVTTFLAGGEGGFSYVVTCRVTTQDGRVDDRSIKLKVKER